MKPTTLSVHLNHFLSEYLAGQRNLGPNTIKAYRDVFVLLLRFCRDEVTPREGFRRCRSVLSQR